MIKVTLRNDIQTIWQFEFLFKYLEKIEPVRTILVFQITKIPSIVQITKMALDFITQEMTPNFLFKLSYNPPGLIHRTFYSFHIFSFSFLVFYLRLFSISKIVLKFCTKCKIGCLQNVIGVIVLVACLKKTQITNLDYYRT